MDSLSAGERQMLALSILWGLALASNRKLPNIIDTPLARLDSAHRKNIINNYLPNASEQMIVLSTDEEIDQVLLEGVKPHLSRCYQLVYSDKTQSTNVTEGYFFN